MRISLFDIIILIVSFSMFGINGLAISFISLAYLHICRYWFVFHFVPDFCRIVSKLLRYGYMVENDNVIKSVYKKIYWGSMDDYSAIKKMSLLSFILLPKLLLIINHLKKLEKDFNI